MHREEKQQYVQGTPCLLSIARTRRKFRSKEEARSWAINAKASYTRGITVLYAQSTAMLQWSMIHIACSFHPIVVGCLHLSSSPIELPGTTQSSNEPDVAQ